MFGFIKNIFTAQKTINQQRENYQEKSREAQMARADAEGLRRRLQATERVLAYVIVERCGGSININEHAMIKNEYKLATTGSIERTHIKAEKEEKNVA